MVIAEIIDKNGIIANTFPNGDISLSPEQGNDYIYINSIIPQYPTPKELEYLNPKVSNYFIEAQENLHNLKTETCAMLCRKALDVATADILEKKQAKDGNGNVLTRAELIKRPLKRRVELLFGNQIITQDMHDWATIIREDGNDAVHSGDDYSQSDTKELVGFTEVFLMYLYTLPQMVIEKRKNNQP